MGIVWPIQIKRARMIAATTSAVKLFITLLVFIIFMAYKYSDLDMIIGETTARVAHTLIMVTLLLAMLIFVGELVIYLGLRRYHERFAKMLPQTFVWSGLVNGFMAVLTLVLVLFGTLFIEYGIDFWVSARGAGFTSIGLIATGAMAGSAVVSVFASFMTRDAIAVRETTKENSSGDRDEENRKHTTGDANGEGSSNNEARKLNEMLDVELLDYLQDPTKKPPSKKKLRRNEADAKFLNDKVDHEDAIIKDASKTEKPAVAASVQPAPAIGTSPPATSAPVSAPSSVLTKPVASPPPQPSVPQAAVHGTQPAAVSPKPQHSPTTPPPASGKPASSSPPAQPVQVPPNTTHVQQAPVLSPASPKPGSSSPPAQPVPVSPNNPRVQQAPVLSPVSPKPVSPSVPAPVNPVPPVTPRVQQVPVKPPMQSQSPSGNGQPRAPTSPAYSPNKSAPSQTPSGPPRPNNSVPGTVLPVSPGIPHQVVPPGRPPGQKA